MTLWPARAASRRRSPRWMARTRVPWRPGSTSTRPPTCTVPDSTRPA